MKRLLFIIFMAFPFVTRTKIPVVVKDFVKDQAKEVGKDTVKYLQKTGLKELSNAMTNDEVLLNACIEGMVLTTTQAFPPEYFFAILGEKMGVRLNPAHYSVEVRRSFYRCLCSNPDAAFKAFQTISPLPLLTCAPALGYGFVAAVKEFMGDLGYYRDSLLARYVQAKIAAVNFLYGKKQESIKEDNKEKLIIVDDK